MDHELIDALSGFALVAVTVYGSIGLYLRTRRDSRLDEIEEKANLARNDIYHIEGFLTAVSSYRPRV